jgi:hypothetical protein
MRDDDGPGPLTRESAARASEDPSTWLGVAPKPPWR